MWQYITVDCKATIWKHNNSELEQELLLETIIFSVSYDVTTF